MLPTGAALGVDREYVQMGEVLPLVARSRCPGGAWEAGLDGVGELVPIIDPIL